MAKLSKATIQKLAVLRALSMWRRGAFGPVRIHKTLFFADKQGQPNRHLFTFKKWMLGQYSDEISSALNGLKAAGRISAWYDGPSERIKAELTPSAAALIDRLFSKSFPAWTQQLPKAFREWGLISNDRIIKKAHEDATYTQKQHGDVIFKSFADKEVEVDLSDDEAERVSDLVDEQLHGHLKKCIDAAVKRQPTGEDWRSIYFGGKNRAARPVHGDA